MLIFPDEITPHNVNSPIYFHDGIVATSSIVSIAMRQKDADQFILPYLISMGAIFNAGFLVHCEYPKNIECVLELCDDVKNWEIEIFLVYGWPAASWRLVMDYGVNTPKKWSLMFRDIAVVTTVEEYGDIIFYRVSLSRKTLAALIISCKGGPFRALRDIVILIAKGMWCVKRSEGACMVYGIIKLKKKKFFKTWKRCSMMKWG